MERKNISELEVKPSEDGGVALRSSRGGKKFFSYSRIRKNENQKALAKPTFRGDLLVRGEQFSLMIWEKNLERFVMGGFGSGRKMFRLPAWQMLHLDVRVLHQRGCLRPGLGMLLHWPLRNGGEASIGVITKADSIRLYYRTGGGEHIDEVVRLDLTPCNYGGTRPWFLCPKCGRRVGVLLGGPRFWCRHCHNVAYGVENESKLDRLLRKSEKLRTNVKANPGVARPIMHRPKYMHQRIFDLFRSQVLEVEVHFCQALARRFDLRI